MSSCARGSQDRCVSDEVGTTTTPRTTRGRWMWVVPDPLFAGSRHRTEVRWGDWRLCHGEPMDAHGAYFVHTKGDDGLSKPLEVNG